MITEGCMAGSLLLFPAPPFLPPPPHGGEICSGGDRVVFQIPPTPAPGCVQGVRFAERGGQQGVGSMKNLFPSLKPNGEGQRGSGGPCRKADGQFPPSRGRAVGLGALSPGQPRVPCILKCVKAGGIWGGWGLRYSVSGGRTLSP